MSTVNTIRTGIHAALAALPGLTTIQRYDALRVEDASDVAARKPALVLVYLGRRKAPGPVSQRTQNTIRYRWSIAVVTENWRDGISALSETTYGAEALSDSLDAIRAVEICTVNSEPIYLQLVDDQITTPTDRPVNGGPAVYLTNWETTEVLS